MDANQIAKHMLGDTDAYGEFIQEMLEKHLDANPDIKLSWEKWFLGLDPDINVALPQPNLNSISHES